MTAKEAAIDLIRHEVERGDDIGSIRRSWMGRAGERYTASVGGSIFPLEYLASGLRCPNELIKRCGSDKILVKEVDGKIVNQTFSLDEIYRIIKEKRGLQLTLI